MIIPGFWYTLPDTTQIKLTREHFFNPDGWQILVKENGIEKTLFHSQNRIECLKHISKLTTARTQMDIKTELKNDIEFLEKEGCSKCWEIAQHLKYILEHTNDI